jgi:hypothetical protein
MKIMNKNEQIIESLHRVKLLMGYKSTMTLTENVENLKDSFINESIIITEGVGKPLLTALFGGVDDAVRAASILAKDAKYIAATKSIDDAIAVTGKIAQTDGRILTKSKDIITAMEKGTLSSAGVNQLKAGFLKSGNLGPELRNTLVNQASVDARNIKAFQGMTHQEIKDVLVKKGFNTGIADDIATQIHPKVGGKLPVKGKTTTTGKGKTTTTGKGKNTAPPKKPRVRPGSRTYKPDPSKVTVWETIKGRIVGLTRGKIFKYLLIAGGLYLVYKWWTDEGSAPFPDCISKNIPQEDFEKMVSDGLDYVLITDTGNTTIDQNGGGRFFDDKKFTTGNGKYSGTWSEKDGGIVISVSGTDYSISCEGMSDSDDNNDNGNGDGDSVTTYKVCDSFPLTKDCKGGKVSEFQKCIGVSADGKFGPKTEQGLKDKGYDITVTQEVYDKILKNCGKSNSDINPNAPKPDAGSPDDDK